LATFADLLTGPMSRQALAHRDIAAVYRILRNSGVSQASIALKTGQKQSEVSEIISGRQVKSVVLLERIADGLGVPRGWMGLAHESGPAPMVQEDLHSGDLGAANLLRHAVVALQGTAREAIAALRRADDFYHTASDEPLPWEHFGAAVSHMEGRTYFTLSRFGRAGRALSTAVDGARHGVTCTVVNSGLLAAVQLRSGELETGLCTAQQVIRLAKGLRSVSCKAGLRRRRRLRQPGATRLARTWHAKWRYCAGPHD
jgi:transcriptional regulator with XRE-family HTH domain